MVQYMGLMQRHEAFVMSPATSRHVVPDSVCINHWHRHAWLDYISVHREYFVVQSTYMVVTCTLYRLQTDIDRKR